MTTVATYAVGPAKRPNITHDNGFLDQFAMRAPTIADQARYKFWQSKLELAEAGQNVPFMPHNDIPDALGAYRHFLEGSGRNRSFSYERYVANDPSGKTGLKNMVIEAQNAAYDLYERQFREQDADFEFTGGVLSASSGSIRFPYPATENWQKAIGAHNFWISGKVSVLGKGRIPEAADFEMIVTVHVEDMYNFNPGAQDIATGIPDDENGIFETTGLAKQYLNVSELVRDVSWNGRPGGPETFVSQSSGRDRKPSDNRRARNRT